MFIHRTLALAVLSFPVSLVSAVGLRDEPLMAPVSQLLDGKAWSADNGGGLNVRDALI